MTLPIRYRTPLSGLVHVCVRVVLSVCLSRSVRWQRRCLSFYVLCLFAARVPFSLDPGASSSPPRRLRQCSDRAPKTPMRRSTPSSALSSVVESSQPDDGGRSTTLLLVAFPLPSRSLLAGPDAAISPRTRTKNRLACVIVLSCLVLSRLIFAVPPKKKKNRTASIFPRRTSVSLENEKCSYLLALLFS